MCPRQVTQQDEGKILRIVRTDIPEVPRTIRVFLFGGDYFLDIHMRRYNVRWWRAVSEGHE